MRWTGWEATWRRAQWSLSRRNLLSTSSMILPDVSFVFFLFFFLSFCLFVTKKKSLVTKLDNFARHEFIWKCSAFHCQMWIHVSSVGKNGDKRSSFSFYRQICLKTVNDMGSCCTHLGPFEIISNTHGPHGPIRTHTKPLNPYGLKSGSHRPCWIHHDEHRGGKLRILMEVESFLEKLKLVKSKNTFIFTIFE